MQAITIYPKTKKQSDALKIVFKEMDIMFEDKSLTVEESPYNTEFVNKIKRGEAAAKQGKGVKVDMSNLWK